jgi:Ca-activated chloride channel family protein
MKALFASLLFTMATVSLTAQPAPKLEVMRPLEGEYVSGNINLEARLVPLAAEREISRVTFHVDGKIVCTIERRPWSCPWNAGAAIREYQVRVAVDFANGQPRLVKTVRTRGVGLAEATGVSAVKVTATVKDNEGRFVSGLRPADFKVFEAEAQQTITGFAAEKADVTVALALDTSGSMSFALPAVKLQAKEFLRLLPPAWPTPVLAFDNSVFVISPPGASLEDRARNIDMLKAWGGTALYNAVVRALREVESGEGRKAVVVFTDGDDRNSTIDLTEVRKAIEASDAVVYFVASGEAARNRAMMKAVEELADISGGRVLRVQSDDDIERAFTEVREEIRNQYLLTYVPPALARPGTWRPLSVKVGCEGCRVRARKGYTVLAPKR